MPERHVHQAECWKRYEPCGEHHGHSHSCGGGELGPKCPQYVAPTHKATVHPRHRKLAAAWMDDWERYHSRYEWRDRKSLPRKGYAQGSADQDEALINRVAGSMELGASLLELIPVEGLTAEKALRLFAAALRDGSWEKDPSTTPPVADRSHVDTEAGG